METENKHWTNQVAHIEAKDYAELVEKLNAFYKDRFVIATQVFPYSKDGFFMIDAIVYFKVPPKADGE